MSEHGHGGGHTAGGPQGGAASTAGAHAEDVPRVDVNERGAKLADGTPQLMNRRLFVQLMVFDVESSETPAEAAQTLYEALGERDVGGVVYEDVNAPRSIGLVTYDEDPAVFVKKVRPAVLAAGAMRQRPDFTMLGRTYASGFEADLPFWLIDRPKSVLENPAWPWCVWYPLRRSGAFAKLEPREQAAILREHAIIGRAYGAEDLAHDVRLVCHGLDAHDNDFVIGLIGKDLHPLSHVVQSMRKTRQTSEFIVQMGPFFIGHAIYRTRTPQPK